MKNKLLGVILICLLAVTAMFSLAACGDQEDSSSSSNVNRSYVTLSAWVIWEGHDEQDAAALEIEAAVQSAFNDICMETYSTKVEFTWCASEAEYKQRLDARYAAIENSGVLPSADTQVGDEDDYPSVVDNQIDLVLMLDKDMYQEYVSAGRLTKLDSFLNSTYKSVYNELNSYLRYTKAKQGTSYGYYAVPNIHSFGEYTYLLVNKAAASHFQFAESDFSSFADCMELIDEIYNSNDPKFANMAPVLEAFDYYNARFYTNYQQRAQNESSVFDYDLKNTGANGLLATFWKASTNLGGITEKSIEISIQNQDYLTYLSFANWANANAATIYAADPEAAYKNHNFGIAIVKGDYSLRNDYSDYYCIVLDNPRITDEDLFHGMWAVSSYSINSGRAMEILAALETNKSLVNTLVYGVKGENYNYSTVTGCATSNSTYYMNPCYCGNIFNVYPDTAHGQDVAWLNALSKQKTEWLCDVWTDFGYITEKYYVETVLVKPTCTEGGVTIRQCPDCSEDATVVFTDALGHSDNNNDGYCDRCKLHIVHVDKNLDGYCDNEDCMVHIKHVDVMSEEYGEDSDPDGYCDDPDCDEIVLPSNHRHSYEAVAVIREKSCGTMEITKEKCKTPGCTAVRYRTTAKASGHVDTDHNGICDTCTATMPAEHDHRDYYLENAMHHGNETTLNMIQNVSDDIFDVLLNFEVGELSLLAYRQAFFGKASELNDKYFVTAGPDNISNTITYITNATDISTGAIFKDRLGGNIHAWWQKVLETMN